MIEVIEIRGTAAWPINAAKIVTERGEYGNI